MPLTSNNLCSICTAAQTDKQVRLKRLTDIKNKIEGYYYYSEHCISKKWYEEFKKALDNGDPSKIDPNFNKDIICPHGGLKSEYSLQKKLSPELLKTLIEEFPCNDRIEIESFSKSCEDCDEEKRRQKEEKYKKSNTWYPIIFTITIMGP